MALEWSFVHWIRSNVYIGLYNLFQSFYIFCTFFFIYKYLIQIKYFFKQHFGFYPEWFNQNLFSAFSEIFWLLHQTNRNKKNNIKINSENGGFLFKKKWLPITSSKGSITCWPILVVLLLLNCVFSCLEHYSLNLENIPVHVLIPAIQLLINPVYKM